jgi:branched-chain amino acid transport system permease protein
MSTVALLLTQCVNALSQSALLFFLGVGLTLIFGLMRIVNFAHGALYMLGAFVGYSLSHWSGNYWLALAGAPVVVGLLGAAFWRRRWSPPRTAWLRRSSSMPS